METIVVTLPGPYYDKDGIRIYNGDCRSVMASLPEDSVDSIVCDPPYGLTSNKQGGSGESSLNERSPAGRSRIGTGGGFMGQQWDSCVPGIEFWREAIRIAKPGAYLLAFGGTRTYHRLTCAIEDAGWEIRDSLCWMYGSGFPKSMDLSKAFDKDAGAEREVVGKRKQPDIRGGSFQNRARNEVTGNVDIFDTVPATDEAKQWEGWGTALKPAYEPIILARKPLIGTVIQNVREYGVGGLNIDACRIGDFVNTTPSGVDRRNEKLQELGYRPNSYAMGEKQTGGQTGRWPSNVILSHAADCKCVGTRIVGSGSVVQSGHRSKRDNPVYGSPNTTRNAPDSYGAETVEAWECSEDCPIRLLDAQVGPQTSGGTPKSRNAPKTKNAFGEYSGSENPDGIGSSSGNVSRFFYCAKADSKERRGSKHPTVKPLDLMRYLVRLVTPIGGVVCDPFMGSGSTIEAAREEHCKAIGIDLYAEYCSDAANRLAQGVLF